MTEYEKSKANGVWLVCTNCGNSYQKPKTEFKRNLRLGRTCFCSVGCSVTYYRKGNPRPKGNYYDISKHAGNLADIYTPFKYYIKKAKSRKKHKMSIDVGYLAKVWAQQKGLCAITGKPIFLKMHRTTSQDLGLFTASLDRIDSKLGYIEGNVQFVSVGINLAKGTRSDKEVKEWLNVINGDSWDYVKSDIVHTLEKIIPL